MLQEKVNQIINEEIEAAVKFRKESFGARNGEEFPELARSILSSTKIRSAIAANALKTILMLVASDPDELKKEFDSPDTVATKEEYNRIPLDFFWLGYRLGRRMEREEAAVLRGMEE